MTIEHIDRLTPENLERMASCLLRHDGCTILRSHGANDQSADVIAVSSHGERIVLQCKFLSEPKARVGPVALHALNGTTSLTAAS